VRRLGFLLFFPDAHFIGSVRSQPLVEDIVSLKTGRVIFKRGTESAVLEGHLSESKIVFITAYTLVMLQSMQFYCKCRVLICKLEINRK